MKRGLEVIQLDRIDIYQILKTLILHKKNLSFFVHRQSLPINMLINI